MTTREIILEAVLKNQPAATSLPDVSEFKGDRTNIVQTYIDVFKTIGGAAYLVDDLVEVRNLLHENFDFTKRIVTTLPNLTDIAELVTAGK
jgi:L-lactate dehydrogenase complex protein LldG